MFICEIRLFHWYFPQFCKSDMSKHGHLEVPQRVPSTSRQRESTVSIIRSRGCKTSPMLNQAELEILTAHKYKNKKWRLR